MPRWQALPTWLGRLVYALTRDLTQGYLSLQAMSLVYTTILALVPLLAVTFSALKGFGVHNQLEPLLLNVLAPLGEGGIEITTQIIGFVDNMRVGVLGSVGLAMLIYTVISLVQKIEQVFNFTWRVPLSAPSRSASANISASFWWAGVVLLGRRAFGLAGRQPLRPGHHRGQAVRTCLGGARSSRPLSDDLADLRLFLRLRSQHPGPRHLGDRRRADRRTPLGVIGGMFSYFMASSTRLMAIYSSLAILILFMIWIYIAWLILLVGASIAFYHQHPEYLRIRSRDLQLSNRQRERLALILAGQVARRYECGRAALEQRGARAKLATPGCWECSEAFPHGRRCTERSGATDACRCSMPCCFEDARAVFDSNGEIGRRDGPTFDAALAGSPDLAHALDRSRLRRFSRAATCRMQWPSKNARAAVLFEHHARRRDRAAIEPGNRPGLDRLPRSA
jgi:uncharacterized BrkB/YihY/UPF0761 family membrane protein